MKELQVSLFPLQSGFPPQRQTPETPNNQSNGILHLSADLRQGKFNPHLHS